MTLLIKNASIVTSSDTFNGDIFVEDEIITNIGQNINIPDGKNCRVIDATGKYAIPGGIDAHVHFSLPVNGTITADDFESGSKAAACGGVTTFIDFAHQQKGASPLDALEARIKEADGNCHVDYSLHMGLTDINEEVLKLVPELVNMGIPSFKLYMTYEALKVGDASIFSLLEETAKNNGLVIIHAENPDIIKLETNVLKESGNLSAAYLPHSRPAFSEIEAIKRVLYFTEITKSRVYIVHVSTGESVELIALAKGRGVEAYAETCPQYMLLDDTIYLGQDGYLFTSNPPLRKNADRLWLWKGLIQGTIQVISTDHCSFSKDQREPGKYDFTSLPNGLAGVETLVPLLYSFGVVSGGLSLNEWVSCISTNPARMFGLYPQKGSLSPGSDADIVIFDPKKETRINAKNLHYNIDYSPYEGMFVQGWPEMTISRGKVIYENGTFKGDKSHGKFTKRFYPDPYFRKFT